MKYVYLYSSRIRKLVVKFYENVEQSRALQQSAAISREVNAFNTARYFDDLSANVLNAAYKIADELMSLGVNLNEEVYVNCRS